MRRALSLSCVVSLLYACGSEGSGPASSVGATCESTCEKAVALACPNETYTDLTTCVTQCEEQVAQCTDTAIVSAYLDCVETTPMVCGDTTGTASSPECLSQGLAYFACIEGLIDGGDGTDGTDGDGTDGTDGGPADIPPMPTAAVGQFVANMARGGVDYTLDCTPDTATELTLDGGVHSTEVAVVRAVCQTTANKNEPDAKLANLVLTIPSLQVGEYSIASEPPAVVNEHFDLSWRTGGEGWAFSGNKTTSETYEGTVTIVENGGSGGTMRVRMTARWNQGYAIEGNSQLGQPDGTPGAIAAEWAFTLP